MLEQKILTEQNIGLVIKVKKRKTKLDHLKDHYSNLPQPHAWLPINLNREIIDNLFAKYWSYDTDYNIDKVIAVCTQIIIKRYKVREEKRDQIWHNGFAHVHSNEWREWIGKDYIKYIKVLEAAGVIEVYNGYLQSSYSKSYRIQSRWMLNAKENRNFSMVYYENYNLIYKSFKRKIENWEYRDKAIERRELIQYAKAIAMEFDLDGLRQFLYKRRLRNRKKIENRDLQFIRYTRLKEMDDFGYNHCDDFGHRLHTPFTRMKKEYRRFIRIDGESVTEVDIKNSQVFFFACICNYPEVAYQLLKDEWHEEYDLQSCIDYLHQMHQSNSDFQNFTEMAFNGSIYEHIQLNLDETKEYSRKAVKKKVFNTIFADETKSIETRSKIANLFPSVIEVCDVLNANGQKLISKLMHRFEAKLMIDKIAGSATSIELGKFITVHDSIICAASQADKFKDHIQNIFFRSGLPTPAIQLSA